MPCWRSPHDGRVLTRGVVLLAPADGGSVAESLVPVPAADSREALVTRGSHVVARLVVLASADRAIGVGHAVGLQVGAPPPIATPITPALALFSS